MASGKVDEIKCLDTYALIELYYGNERFKKIIGEDFVIPEIILAEFFGVLLRRFGEEEANMWFRKFEPYTRKIDLWTLRNAVVFRQGHSKSNISFFDAVGYLFAVENHYLFVTGDKEFERFTNVLFIKK